MVSKESHEFKINVEEIKKNIDCLIQWQEYDALSNLVAGNAELQELTWDFKVLTNIISLYKLQRDMGESTILRYGASMDACVMFYIRYTYYLLAANKNQRDSDEWGRLISLIEKEKITSYEIITTCAYIKLSEMEAFIESLGTSLYESGNRRLSIQLLTLYLDIYEVADGISLDLASILLYEEDIEGAKGFLQKVQVKSDEYMELSRQIEERSSK